MPGAVTATEEGLAGCPSNNFFTPPSGPERVWGEVLFVEPTFCKISFASVTPEAYASETEKPAAQSPHAPICSLRSQTDSGGAGSFFSSERSRQRAGNSAFEVTPLVHVRVLFPHRPASVNTTRGSFRPPVARFNSPHTASRSCCSTSLLLHLFLLAHAIVEKAIQHSGCTARPGLLESLAIHATVGFPTITAASQSSGPTGEANASIRFHT
mmetsp:Transcript_54446/g.74421  ORF Transcript_54446/g.74421 Transcript_54446/m.74421 type:complete len:212 (+) Transcript_54446:1094-1729(+)